MTSQTAPFESKPWQERLSHIMETMRELSTQTDPQEMVQQYYERMRQVNPHVDRRLALSRRGLAFPKFRITRFSEWQHPINPWKEPGKLPVLSGGILAELIYGNEPRIINDLVLAADDPAREYLAGMRSLQAIPLLENGESVNMTFHAMRTCNGFSEEHLPEAVWLANLFGRATNNLVLAERVKAAYEEIDRELLAVASIQRSLLPEQLPIIPELKLAAHYQTARRAGGDYYDFFPLPHGSWGLLIADVSGHGTPAAVMMAVMHSIAHFIFRSTESAQRNVELSQHQTQRALSRRQRHVHHRVLCHLSSRLANADILVSRTQSAATAIVYTRRSDCARSSSTLSARRRPVTQCDQRDGSTSFGRSIDLLYRWHH